MSISEQNLDESSILIIVSISVFVFIIFLASVILYIKYKKKHQTNNDSANNINQNQESIIDKNNKNEQNAIDCMEKRSKTKYKDFTENIVKSNRIFYEDKINKQKDKERSPYTKCHYSYNYNSNTPINDESEENFKKALSSVISISPVSIDKDAIFHIFSLGIKKFMNIEENKDQQIDDEIKHAIAFGENIDDAKTQNSFYRNGSGGLAREVTKANKDILKYINLLVRANLHDKNDDYARKYPPFLLFSLITVFNKYKYTKYENEYEQDSSFASIKDQIKMNFSTEEHENLFCTELLCQYLGKLFKSDNDDYILQSAIGMIVNAYEINRMFRLASNDSKVVIFVRSSSNNCYTANKFLWSGLGTGSALKSTKKSSLPIEYINSEILQQFVVLGKKRLEDNGEKCIFEAPNINKMSFYKMLEKLWNDISNSTKAQDRFLAIFTNEKYFDMAISLIKPSIDRFIAQDMYINQTKTFIDTEFKESGITNLDSNTEQEQILN